METALHDQAKKLRLSTKEADLRIKPKELMSTFEQVLNSYDLFTYLFILVCI